MRRRTLVFAPRLVDARRRLVKVDEMVGGLGQVQPVERARDLFSGRVHFALAERGHGAHAPQEAHPFGGLGFLGDGERVVDDELGVGMAAELGVKRAQIVQDPHLKQRAVHGFGDVAGASVLLERIGEPAELAIGVGEIIGQRQVDGRVRIQRLGVEIVADRALVLARVHVDARDGVEGDRLRPGVADLGVNFMGALQQGQRLAMIAQLGCGPSGGLQDVGVELVGPRCGSQRVQRLQGARLGLRRAAEPRQGFGLEPPGAGQHGGVALDVPGLARERLGGFGLGQRLGGLGHHERARPLHRRVISRHRRGLGGLDRLSGQGGERRHHRQSGKCGLERLDQQVGPLF